MTNKEAIERLQRIDFERSNVRDRLAIHMAIAAMRPWKRLSEETPTEPGRYWVYRKDPAWGDYYHLCGNWNGVSFFAHGFPLEDITNWQKTQDPEDD